MCINIRDFCYATINEYQGAPTFKETSPTRLEQENFYSRSSIQSLSISLVKASTKDRRRRIFKEMRSSSMHRKTSVCQSTDLPILSRSHGILHCCNDRIFQIPNVLSSTSQSQKSQCRRRRRCPLSEFFDPPHRTPLSGFQMYIGKEIHS